ncbi:MAG: type II toxin-antitoxin system HicB family antitoxin [Acidobacteria bacterium]|nr:type II toxin-antitoxin system HicB family antitoxin [Acidobacteriota bacterium]
MNSTLKYKGFTAKIDFSADDGVFVGRVLGIDDIVIFHGKTVAELKKEFKESIEFHLEVCAKESKRIKKSFSGKVLLRLPSELHARISEVAASKGKSINEWGKEVLETAVSS